jgi:hypothetical protein
MENVSLLTLHLPNGTRALLMFRVFVSTFLLLNSALLAAPFVTVGGHPTSSLTAYPTLHTLRTFEDRIYMGYGNWSNYPAVTLTCYDPASHRFIIEHSASSDSIERLKVINGCLYAPSFDPIHYEDFKDYTYRPTGKPWRDFTAAGFLHLFDFASINGRLFAAGSTLSVGASVYQSLDDGRTWTYAFGGGPSRYYWAYSLQGKLYVHGRVWDPASPSSSVSWTNPYPDPNKVDTTNIAVNGSEVVLAKSGSNLFRHNAGDTTPVTIRSWVKDYTWAADAIYTLETNTIQRGIFTNPTTVTWTVVPVSSIPGSATCIEVLDGKVYVGTSSGTLHVAKLDGTAMPPMSWAAVGNVVPDQLGRGLAWNGSQLITGAPDASSSEPMSGRVQFWEQNTGGPSENWSEVASLTPAIPDFSGWFGKDIACADGILAVVEAGRDSTNRDRGSSAEVHLFTGEANVWTKRASLPIPFAHSVSILDGILAVGSANPAANQAAGLPGIHLYQLNGSGDSLTATFLRQSKPNIGYGYKPVARALIVGDLLIGGFSGDLSRDSSPGALFAFSKVSGGSGFSESPSSGWSSAGGRYGYSLAAETPYLAAGVPRNSTFNGIPHGMIAVSTISPTQRLQLAQNIHAPMIEMDAQFGAALGMANGWLLVGAPGAERMGLRHGGRVFLYRRNTEGTYLLKGELPRPAASEGEFGIEIAAGPDRFAIGSRYSNAIAPLQDRVAIVPIDCENPFEFWAAMHHLPAGDDDLSADPDGDGLNNLMEYASNQDPLSPNQPTPSASVISGSPVFQTAGAPALSFLRPTLDAHLAVSLFESSDLTTWGASEITSTVVQSYGTYERRQFLIPVASSGSKYYRLLFRYTP